MSIPEGSKLLSAVEAIYQTALSPNEYEAFVGQWDSYVAKLEPGSEEAGHLLAHIDRASAILDRLHPASRESFEPENLVERETGPAAIVNGAGNILVCNTSWQRAMGAHARHITDLTGDSEEQDQLLSTIHSLHDVASLHTGFTRLTDSNGNGVMGVTIRRLLRGETGMEDARYLVRTSHAIWSDSVGDVLAAEFNLTQAELSLLERIVVGDSFAEISGRTKRSLDTLKTQSKAIYRKMGIGGREDAVRLSLQLHHLLQGAAPRRAIRPQSEDQGQVTLKDGRRIAWVRRGRSGTRPLLFLHGMTLGHGMLEAFTSALGEQGLHMICVDRPGYGLSDPPVDWRCTVEEWAKLFPQLLDGLGLERIPIVTHTSGILYGCAAARAWPERVSGICALAGGVPINDPAMLADYPPMVRLLSRTARLSPRALRFVLSSSAAFYRSESGRNRLIERTYGNSETDRIALTNPGVRAYVHEGFGLIDGGGFDGFVGDGLQVFADWSDLVADLICPLHYVIGDQDPICPLSWARAFAQKHAHVEVTPIQNAGQMLHHTHPARIADMVSTFARGLDQG
ncbi:MAG: alpha/beta hydrolase [Hyphomonadaceae bacterium]|nr:alpha/beta hydrolase [Hyphomonadaceae bacterium]